MRWTPHYTHRAVKDLKKIDKPTARRILHKINWFCATGDPLKFSKNLTGPLTGLYRFRIGDWRVIFDINLRGTLSILLVLNVKHRKEVYE
ncbi:MAG: type II toxin-antitoxin system RelE/ParE family toxin [bacterium]|nr:type II toxin-antitoxin system RelE/ParE family toxin [bacterium]